MQAQAEQQSQEELEELMELEADAAEQRVQAADLNNDVLRVVNQGSQGVLNQIN